MLETQITSKVRDEQSLAESNPKKEARLKETLAKEALLKETLAKEALAKEALLYEKLQASGVSYQSFEHEPVFSVAQSHALADRVPGLNIRNLFLRDRKRNFFLLCLPALLALDLKMLGRANVAEKLGIDGRLSFAKHQDLQSKLGVMAGAVNPFAIICDSKGEVNIIIDSTIANCQQFNAHPMRNDRSITISGAELLSFLAQEKHQPIVFDFAKMAQL